MDLENIVLDGGSKKSTPLVDWQEVDPKTNLNKGGGKFIPLIGIEGSDPMIETHVGKVPDSYQRILGDNYHPEFAPSTIQTELARNQGTVGQAINTIIGLPGTVLGAGVEDLGYLLSGPTGLTKAHEDSFASGLINLGRSMTEGNEEAFPIFRDENNAPKVDLFSPSYWLKNIRMVESMLPVGALAYAGGAAVGAVAGLAGEFAGESASLLTKMGVNRHIFNTMFAASNYKEEYDIAKNQGATDDIADQRGALAASASYRRNWALAPLDLLQYGMWANAFKKGAPEVIESMPFAKLFGKPLAPGIASKVGLAAKEAVIGGTQLGFQWAMNEEGKYVAEKAFDPSLNVSGTTRMDRYLKNGDFWSNVFFGGVAGGLMTGVVKQVKDLFKGDPQVNEVKSWASDVDRLHADYKAAEASGDEGAKQRALDEMLHQAGVRGGQTGMTEQSVDWFRKIVKGDQLTPKEMKALNLDPNKVSTLKDVDIETAVDKIRKASDEYKNTFKEVMDIDSPLNKSLKKLYAERTDNTIRAKESDYARMYAGILAKQSIKVSSYEEHSLDLQSQITTAKAKIPNYDLLSPNRRSQLDYEADLEVLTQQKTINEAWNADNTNLALKTAREEDLKKAKTDKQKERINQYYDDQEVLQTIKDAFIQNGHQKQLDDINAKIDVATNTLNQLKEDYKRPEFKDSHSSDEKVNFNPDDYYEYKRLMGVKTMIDNSLVGERDAYNRYRKGDIGNATTKSEWNKWFNDLERDNSIESNDYVNWKDQQGATHVGKVLSIDDKNYTVKEVDPTSYKELDAEPVIKTDLDLDLVEKIGDVFLNSLNTEPISNRDLSESTVRQSLMELSGTNRALAKLFESLSTSHINPVNGKVVPRNEDFKNHISDPSNKMDTAQAKYQIDWEIEYWDKDKSGRTKGQKGYKQEEVDAKHQLRDQLKSGNLSPEQIADILSVPVDPKKAGDFSSYLVDKMPIKVVIHDGEEKFDTGLYVHDSDFWNVKAPSGLDFDPESFILQRRQECRTGRREMITHLLSGNEVTTSGLKKFGGHFNTVYKNGVRYYGNVHDRFGVEHGTVKLWVAVPGALRTDMRMRSSADEIDIHDGLSEGGIYAETYKTCDGKRALVKLNPSRLTREHAEILYDAIKLTQTKNRGYKAPWDEKDNRVKGLTAGEVIQLLVLMGDRSTNPGHSNNADMPEYRKSKALFVNHKHVKDNPDLVMLHYGPNKFDLFESEPDQANDNREKFIKWAMDNKNYRVPIDNREMGLELNKPFHRYFRIGEGDTVFENKVDEEGKGLKPFSAVLMDTEAGRNNDGTPYYMLSTDVDRLKDTEGNYIESVTHSPVIDLNNGTRYDVKGQQPGEPTGGKPKEPVLPPSDITKPEDVAEHSKVSRIKQLPAGTEIWVEKPDGSSYLLATRRGSGTKSHIELAPGFGQGFGLPDDTSLRQANQEKITDLFTKLLSINKAIHFGVRPKEEVKPVEPVEGVEPEVKPVESPTTETLKSNPELPTDFDNVDAFGIPKEKYTPMPGRTEPISKEQLDWLRKKLGPQNVQLTDKLIEIANKVGKQHFGSFQADVIKIFNAAPGEVLYHESFHRVSLGYLNEFERQAVYSDARKRYGLKQPFPGFYNVFDNEGNNVTDRIIKNIEDIIKNDPLKYLMYDAEKNTIVLAVDTLLRQWENGRLVSTPLHKELRSNPLYWDKRNSGDINKSAAFIGNLHNFLIDNGIINEYSRLVKPFGLSDKELLKLVNENTFKMAYHPFPRIGGKNLLGDMEPIEAKRYYDRLETNRL